MHIRTQNSNIRAVEEITCSGQPRHCGRLHHNTNSTDSSYLFLTPLIGFNRRNKHLVKNCVV